jgi:hypothetical protein
MRMCFASIGPRRDSRPNDRTSHKDARPAKTPTLAITIAQRKFMVSKIRMTDLPVMNPWYQIFSVPVTGLLIWWFLDECSAVVRSVNQVTLLPLAAELDSATATTPGLPGQGDLYC